MLEMKDYHLAIYIFYHLPINYLLPMAQGITFCQDLSALTLVQVSATELKSSVWDESDCTWICVSIWSRGQNKTAVMSMKKQAHQWLET